MVPAGFGADGAFLGEVWADWRLWALPTRVFVCKHRDKCPKVDLPMVPVEVAGCWS